MTEMFEGIEKCEVIVGDLLVWGKSVEEHDLKLEKVLQRAEEKDLRLRRGVSSTSKRSLMLDIYFGLMA